MEQLVTQGRGIEESYKLCVGFLNFSLEHFKGDLQNLKGCFSTMLAIHIDPRGHGTFFKLQSQNRRCYKVNVGKNENYRLIYDVINETPANIVIGHRNQIY